MADVLTLLSAVSANGSGPVIDAGDVRDELTLDVFTAGTVSAFSVQLQGSLDGETWSNVGSAVTTASAAVNVSTGALMRYFQAVLSGYTGTGSVTVELAVALGHSSPASSGGVTSVNGQTGVVVLTASSVSADASGTSAAETSRAEAAEALLAPLASPALTGSPTAPTKTALTSNTDIATTAYADSAVGVETSRAETAEALKAPLASPALTGTPTAPTATALTTSTQLATTAYADAAVAVEVARAEAAETLKATLSDPLGIGFNSTAPWFGAATNSALVANDVYYVPLLAGGYSMTRIYFQVVTQSGNCAVGWYKNSSGAPGALQATSGSTACPAAGVQSLPLGGTYTPAKGDWLAFAFDNATAKIETISGAPFTIFGAFGMVQNVGSLTFPGTATPVAGASSVPILYGK